MTNASLDAKLDPARFPGMSPRMGAIVGLILGREYTQPVLLDLSITVDGFVVAWTHDGQTDGGHAIQLGEVADLRANLCRLGMAAGLDRAEWAAFSDRVRQRIGLDLDGAEPPMTA